MILRLDGIEQVARDHPLHRLQHRRDQLGLRVQQQAQRDRQGQHPLLHWHLQDDVVDEVALRSATCAAHRMTGRTRALGLPADGSHDGLRRR